MTTEFALQSGANLRWLAKGMHAIRVLCVFGSITIRGFALTFKILGKSLSWQVYDCLLAGNFMQRAPHQTGFEEKWGENIENHVWDTRKLVGKRNDNHVRSFIKDAKVVSRGGKWDNRVFWMLVSCLCLTFRILISFRVYFILSQSYFLLSISLVFH